MTDDSYPVTTCVVQVEDDGVRLDKFLAAGCPALTRTRIAQLIKDGHVKGSSSTPSSLSSSLSPASRVRAGQTFEVVIPPAEEATPQPQSIDLRIVFEDEHLLVIDKPAGMVVHPGAGNPDGTLVNALLAHCGESLSGIGGVKRPGIVHRLDKETSGLLVVAKNDLAHQSLSQQLSKRHMRRIYLAFVWGAISPAKGEITGNIGRHPTHRQKMAMRGSLGKPATTHYRTLETFGETLEQPACASCVECQLETGRTHQIRVHLTHLKHPLIGDPVYGMGLKKNTHTSLGKHIHQWEKEHARQALHAKELSFRHPVSGETLAFESPLPHDIQILVELLRTPHDSI